MKNKFSTFKGVFVPSTEAILGTVLFLLLPTLAADTGLITILAIIVISHTVTLATAFSISDCATNLNNIGGGGMYALSKRSLGKAFGGSIGIQLYLAQAASIGFYCIGFVEPIQPILAPFLQKISFLAINGPGDLLFQKQILASIIFIIFFITVLFGADFTLKIQTFILVILFGSVIAIYLSPFLNLQFNDQPLFYENINKINLLGNRPITISIFFLTFTQFFPAVTGIDAGVGMSGDLKDPKRSLVRGTFLAIGITFTVYIICAVIFTMMRKELLVTGYSNNSPVGTLLTTLLGIEKTYPYKLMGIMIFCGIVFATSSSALSCFMTAPRTAQSLSKDKILPGFLSFLKNDFVKNGDEPRFAILVTFLIGISIIWMGNINVAAAIVGICFLVVYGWLNISAFFERISKNPTFRPTSKNHWSISLYGFLASIIAISLFSPLIGILIIISQFVIFQLILKYKSKNKLEGVWWGVLFTFISRGLGSLNKIVQGSKNWRPIVTAIGFIRTNNTIPQFTFLTEQIGAYKGMIHINYLVPQNQADTLINIVEKVSNYQSNSKVPASTIEVKDTTQAILTLLQSSHPGNLRPNTILLEYTKSIDTLKVINKILSMNNNFLLLKNGEKLNREASNIDIWWRGERNGNLMVLLAYIIKISNHDSGKQIFEKIRIIRKIGKDEDKETARLEMNNLLEKARLSGEVLILPYSDEPFKKTLSNTSGKADLIMMGLPGNYTSTETKHYFRVNEVFLDKEILQYSDLPPILFVKSASVMNLIEE